MVEVQQLCQLNVNSVDGNALKGGGSDAGIPNPVPGGRSRQARFSAADDDWEWA